MITEKKYAKNIFRMRQSYDSRLGNIRLSMNEYVPSISKKIFNKIMQSYTPELMSAYPEINPAYFALADFLEQPRDNILLTSGADMAIKIIFETFCYPHDIVATCSPTFAMYKVHANLLNCRFMEVQTDTKGIITEEKLLSLVQDFVKIIILATPSGVTGYTIPEKTIKKLLSEAKARNIVVVLDETYADFDGIDNSHLLKKYHNLIIVRSFSKSMGLAGLRLGYILTTKRLANMLEKFKPMMEINSLAVQALKIICKNKNILKEAVSEIKESRELFAQSLEKLGYQALTRQGNFVLVDFKEDRPRIEELFKQNHVEYRTFSYPLAQYIRLSVGTKELMKKVIQMIEKK